MWRCYLGDTMSGQIAEEIDVPAFSWTVTVSDATFRTEKDKGVGIDEAGGLKLSWGQLAARSVGERTSLVMTLKRCMVLGWEDADGIFFPVVWGAIGNRSDTWLDTSFDLLSPMALLENRYLSREGTFGAVSGMTEPSDEDEEPQKGAFTRDTVFYDNMSLRGIACEVGSLLTDAKPGGLLPIDWQYAGEKGTHQRTYKGFDVGNNSGADILEKIANVSDGPDIQFRPYMADGNHVRLMFTAGTDGELNIGQSTVHSLAWFPGGGSLQDIQIDFSTPVMRVYMTGSGTDEAMLCHLAEDLTLCTTTDPWPLIEEHVNDSDVDNGALLRNHADAELYAYSSPLFQLSGYVDFADPDVPEPGTIWPGEMVDVWIQGFPTLPDGTYRLRLMEMAGDETTRAKLTFRAEPNPIV